jgi:catechol 2,3-dioxygenase-like lactoylglutathione lyase family enzyme
MKVLFVASFSPIVADPQAARTFYLAGFDLPLDQSQGDYVYGDKLGGVKHFGLWPLADCAESCFGTKTWPAHLRVPQASVEFEVEDVAAAAAELVGKGMELIHPVRTEPWGQVIARVLSPDGLVVGVCYTPWMH